MPFNSLGIVNCCHMRKASVTHLVNGVLDHFERCAARFDANKFFGRRSGARKPVLVGWSLGGTVISNYLAAHGDSGIGGAVYVDGVIELAPEQITPHPKVYRDIVSADLNPP